MRFFFFGGIYDMLDVGRGLAKGRKKSERNPSHVLTSNSTSSHWGLILLRIFHPSDSASRHSLEAPRRSCPVWGAPSLYSKAASLVQKQKPGCNHYFLKNQQCRMKMISSKSKGMKNVSDDRFTIGVAKHCEKSPTQKDIMNVKYAMNKGLQ